MDEKPHTSDPDQEKPEDFISLGSEHPVWDRFFHVAPLVVIGTREADGRYDLAPKHMVTPLGWENHFGFVCTPRHNTYGNAKREGCFTVSYPRPSQVLLASLAAAPRCESNEKQSLDMVETRPATAVDGVLLADAYLHLECETGRVIDDFGTNSLITGRIVEAHVSEDALRRTDKDDSALLDEAPLLAYVSPGRYGELSRTYAFPFHKGWSR
ncbi:MAG: flavin reductase [Gemmatimonadetes bacterium]|nr:flavin reductase [Gemmatimonadota bacterium]